jgi:hypothetical protein
MRAPAGTGATSVSILDPARFASLLDALRDDGYEVVGPTVVDGAIMHGPVTEVDDLPQGVGDRQGPGRYRLVDRGDDTWFAHAVGPTSAKRRLLPPRHPLWTARPGRCELRDRGGRAGAAADRLRGRQALRGRGHRGAGSRVPPRRGRGRGLRREPGGRAAGGRRVPGTRRHLLLPLDGHRPRPRARGRSAHPAAGIADLVLTELTDRTGSWPGPAPRRARRCWSVWRRPERPPTCGPGTQLLERSTDHIHRKLDADGVHDLLLGRPAGR